MPRCSSRKHAGAAKAPRDLRCPWNPMGTHGTPWEGTLDVCDRCCPQRVYPETLAPMSHGGWVCVLESSCLWLWAIPVALSLGQATLVKG